MQDMMYQLGRNLVKQNVIPFETLEQALKIKQSDPYTNQRTLAQVLIDEFEVDPDRIYTEMAQVNNVPALDLAQENLSDKRLQGMRKMFERLSPSMKELAKNEQILIFDYIAKPVPKFIFASVNPANPNISVLARALGTRRHEVRHLITANYVMLQDRIFAPTNEFLENLADTSLEIDDGEGEDGKQMDTSALESELNKSFLVNLAEGMLVEAVRRGASDIHVIPKDVTRTEIHFRLDGKLQPWYSEPGLRPEAFAAVLKDRSRNVDRFEREAAQDGFIQRSVDGHMIRYRVSIMPVVGKEVQFKLESVVIRVLDDRNVITDFNKLGLQHQSKSDFERAISKPQGMVILTGPTGSGKSTTLMAAL
ncbi:MAG: Flp pilus assembly complex ATPase component TadA, partial [Calditrichaeota bacterium]|nr:Flp pilus assembly complex ATPase component TadA [Calditrichota bacterium]